jgi:hypothetical protein
MNSASSVKNIRALYGGSRTPRYNLDGLITTSISNV